MPASQARRLCPTAIVIPPDFTAYREKSREVWALVARTARPTAVDGARRGLRGPDRRREAAARAARADRRGAREDRDPDLGRRRPQPADRQVLLGPRQARRLRGDGPRGGVHPLRHRADAPAARDRPEDRRAPGRARLRHRRPAPGGRRGAARRPLRRPHGALPEGPRDASTTTRRWRPSRGAAKSVSTERTFDEDIASHDELETILRTLSRELCEGLQRKARQGRTVAIKVRLADWTTVTRARTLPDATNDTALVTETAVELLRAYAPAAAGAAARRAAGGLRRPRARQAAGARRAGRPARAAALVVVKEDPSSPVGEGCP